MTDFKKYSYYKFVCRRGRVILGYIHTLGIIVSAIYTALSIARSVIVTCIAINYDICFGYADLPWEMKVRVFRV